jgi:hypothetical protein
MSWQRVAGAGVSVQSRRGDGSRVPGSSSAGREIPGGGEPSRQRREPSRPWSSTGGDKNRGALRGSRELVDGVGGHGTGRDLQRDGGDAGEVGAHSAGELEEEAADGRRAWQCW